MTTDSQGVPIREGDTVAYNLSGSVVPGKVIAVHDPVRVSQWYVKDDIRIVAPDGHVSRVRNGNSVLVLP